MLGGGSNGFRCDWQRAAVRSFSVSRRISEALEIGIGILWGNQSTVLVTQVEFVVGIHTL